MRARWWIVLPLISIVLVFSFNNCTKSNLNGEGYIDSSSNSDLGEQLEANCKTGIATTASLTTQTKVIPELSSGQITIGSSLLVLVDTECYRNYAGQSWITTKLVNQGFLPNNATTTAASLRIENEISGSQLAADAENDNCILKIDNNPIFEFFSLPNDSYYTDASTDQPYLYKINHDKIVEDLYNSYNGINRTVRVAVIDSGVDVNHPDLQNLFLRDLQGNIIALNGIDNSTNVIDAGFHGTHVTGLIAATANNEIGISGVMGQNVKILPIKVSEDGYGIDTAAVTNGIYWAADNGANVINMSLGGPRLVTTYEDAINYALKKGVVIVVAAGNSNWLISDQPTCVIDSENNIWVCPSNVPRSYPTYPAVLSKKFPGMMTVGSMDVISQGRSSFSNYSSTFVDIFAPGSNGSYGILSTVPANLSASGYGRLINNSPIQGTSMASPIAAGAAAAAMALAKSRGYQALPSQIEELFAKGSPTSSTLSNYSVQGRYLDLSSLFNKIDQDMHLSLSTTTDRSNAWGNVSISTHPQSITVNEGASFTLSVSKSSSSAIFVNYQWYKNGIKINGAVQPTYTVNNASYVHQATYKVELSAGTTNVMSQQAQVNVNTQLCP